MATNGSEEHADSIFIVEIIQGGMRVGYIKKSWGSSAEMSEDRPIRAWDGKRRYSQISVLIDQTLKEGRCVFLEIGTNFCFTYTDSNK